MSVINTISCRVSELKEAIKAICKLKMTPMIWGAPGIGKSESVGQLVREEGAELRDVRLSQKLASDIGGLPALDHEAKRTVFFLPSFLPTSGRGYVFLDEINGADLQTRIAAYGFILERRINGYTLPDEWNIIAAGNREEDGSMAPPFERAMNSRFVHLVVQADAEGWLEWATRSEIAPEVMAFIRTYPDRLTPSQSDLENDLAITPSPRSWERVSTIIKNTPDERLQELLVTGVIGEATATSFFQTAKELAEMTAIATILKTPTNDLASVLPTSVAGLNAFGYAMNAATNKENYANVLRVLNAMDEIDAPAFTHLPMNEAQAFAMGLVLSKVATIAPQVYRDPSFIAYDAKRNASNT